MAEYNHQEWAAKQLTHHTKQIAAGLRDMADTVERHARGIELVGRPGRPNYASVAQEIQHNVLWGLANLHLDRLTKDAQEADEARLTTPREEHPCQD